MNKEEILISEILKEKHKIENSGKTPRIILLNKLNFQLLKNWINNINNKNKFSIDGTLFNLSVLKVETIEKFEIK